jgi:hypothetical protein
VGGGVGVGKGMDDDIPKRRTHVRFKQESTKAGGLSPPATVYIIGSYSNATFRLLYGYDLTIENAKDVDMLDDAKYVVITRNYDAVFDDVVKSIRTGRRRIAHCYDEEHNGDMLHADTKRLTFKFDYWLKGVEMLRGD